jgi:heme exporter protein B
MWLSNFKLLLWKELKLAFKGKSLIGLAVGMAVVLSVSVSLPMAGIQIPETVGSTLIWIILLFSCSEVMQRTFLDEETGKTADLLRLLVSPTHVFMSKVIANSIFTIIISFGVTPLLVLWLGFPISTIPFLIPIMIIGSISLALSQGIIGYLLARGSAKGAVYPLIIMPIILPVLISLINLTTQVLEFKPISYTLVIVVIAQSLAILIIGILFLPYLERAV